MWYITYVCALSITSVMSNSLRFLTIWATREALPEARSLKARCWQGPALSRDSVGENQSPLPCLWQLPVSLEVPLCSYNTPICASFSHGLPHCMFVSLCIQMFPFSLLFYFCCCFLILPYCGAWRILLPGPGIEPRPLAREVQHPNHWTTRKFPKCFLHNKDTRYWGPSGAHPNLVWCSS